ncbi:MAG: HDOD domain-containing protein [Gammaproteobacteria bacterium]|nr:HDOD domain-containing protein [Gammaproteobacteria bacterium]
MSSTQKIITDKINQYNKSPLFPLELRSIKKKLAGHDAAIDDFKDYFSRDPVFSWYLIKAGVEATKNKVSQPFAGDHALSTIGLGKTKSLFASLESKSQILSNEVLFSLSSSMLAAELAKQLHNGSNSSQIYWTSLLYQLPETLLWHIDPKPMWEIYYLNLASNKSSAVIEDNKLGFTIQDWSKSIAKIFNFSEELRSIYQKKPPTAAKELIGYIRRGFNDSIPSLKDWHKTDDMLVVMSNKLAKSIMLPWHGHAYQHCFEIMQKTLVKESKKLNKLIQSSIDTVSQNLHQSKLFVPALGYLAINSKPAFPYWLLNQRRKAAQKEAEQTNVTAIVDAKPKIQDEKSIQQPTDTQQSQQVNDGNFNALIKDLINKSQHPDNPAELINQGLKIFIENLNFSRIAFMAVNYQSFMVSTKIALSAEGEAKIRPDFDFKNPTPLKQFIDKPAMMLLSQEQHQKIWPKLPLAIRNQQVEAFLLCSLKPGKQVRALIYVDAKDKACYSKEHLTKVKILVKAINQCLANANAIKEQQIKTG